MSQRSSEAERPAGNASDILGRLRRMKRERLAATGPAQDALRERYREAAAVVHAFNPLQLEPVGGRDEGEPSALDVLHDEVDVAPRPAGVPYWILHQDLRRRALISLCAQGRLSGALEANPSATGTDLVGQYLRRALEGDVFDVESATAEQLSALLKVLRLVDGVTLPNLPDAAAVRRAQVLQRLLEVFRFLVGEHFRGRKAQLQRLREYVGVLPPQKLIDNLWRGVRRVFGWEERPPLMVHGPGGVGKSTLLAKFVLEHFEAGQESRIPFVYIDFDSADVSVREPFGLLLEASRQLEAQVSAEHERWDKLRSTLGSLRSSYRTADVLSEDVSSLESSRLSYLEGDIEGVLGLFGEVFHATFPEGRPLLLVLDTFEEVQYESRDSIELLWKVLGVLQRSLPTLRLVISGRTLEESIKVESLPLGDLDQEAAQGYLAAHCVGDDGFRRELFDSYGGNPLTLRLIIEVLRRETREEFLSDKPQARMLMFFRIERGVIQGMLYRRILSHIHSPDVRKLAHPGLLLRQLSPELIQHVLAKPCGLTIETQAEAQRLFDELARETSLVTMTEDGYIRLRSDLRRVLIAQFSRDRDELTRDIHRRGVRFFKQRDDLRSRAEEIYHRLSLGQAASTLDGRWVDGLRSHLVGSLEELPQSSQAYLASQFDDVDLPSEVWRRADISTWERHALGRTRRLLKRGEAERAIELLGQRSPDEWTPLSGLVGLKAEALLALGDAQTAISLIVDELALTDAQELSRYRFELLMLLAHAHLAVNRPEAARSAVDQAIGAAAALDATQAMRAHVVRLELLNLEGKRGSEPFVDSARVTVKLFRQASDAKLRKLPTLTRRLGAVLGEDDPDLLARAVRIGGLRQLDEVEINLLSGSLDQVERELDEVETVRKGFSTFRLKQSKDQVAKLRVAFNDGDTRLIQRNLSNLLVKEKGLTSLGGFRSFLRSFTESMVDPSDSSDGSV